MIADELQEIHIRLRALGRQLDDQADRAPYPFITERLQSLGAIEERNAVEVARHLAALGRNAASDGAAAGAEGRNCWERLVHLQDRYRELIQRLKLISVRWADEYPDEAGLAARLRDSALASRAVVGDLVARADPHALD